MLEITKESIYKIKNSVTVKNILGETFFILDSESGKQYNLSEMEYKIIDCICKGVTFGEIVDNLAKEYNASIEKIEEDLKEYVASLLEEGLIFA